MTPIETLMNEHRFIESVLDALESYTGRLATSADTDPADLAKFVRFIGEFADRCHHGKEEDILFETMIENGFPREAGPIAVMMFEHVEGRRYVGILSDAVDHSASWSDEDRGRIRRAAMGYAELLRAHIMKEDQILYPAAESRLGGRVMEDIGRRFDQFEREKTGEGAHEELHALAEELIKRYAPAAQGCQHHHTH
jgi:hemerythrin-like domain-containing protein